MSFEDRMKDEIGKEVAQQTSKKVGRVVGTVGAIFAGIFFALFLGFLFGWVIQWLWNNTLSSIFEWPTITYWEAVGLFILAKLFFGFGHSGGHRHHKRVKTEEEKERKVREWWRKRMGGSIEESARAAGVPADEMFRKYWVEEGKAAFDAYVASKKGDDK